MTLSLAIETSSRLYGVALVAGSQVLATVELDRAAPSFVDVGVLAESVLDTAGYRVADLDRLAVNIGPGNLTSVRAGLAYVNALAFARDLPVVGLDSLTLLAVRALDAGWPAPVLALRSGGGDAVYAGLHDADRTSGTRHGELEDVVDRIARGIDRLSLCGAARDRARVVLEAGFATVDDTGVDVPDVAALVSCLVSGRHGAGEVAVSPLNERSPAFSHR